MIDTDLPLACVPGAIPRDERHAHFQLLQHLFGSCVRERRALPDGYAYRFDPDAFDDLTRWMRHERNCCPFLRFELEVTTNGGPLWLRLTGPGTPHAFLDATLAGDAELSGSAGAMSG
jgi:hypothetical protein